MLFSSAAGYALVCLLLEKFLSACSFGSFDFSPAVGDALLAVLVPVLLYFFSPLALWLWFLTAGSLAVVPSLLPLQRHFVVVYDSVVRICHQA